MSKIRLNHIDWENYDELDELYDDSMEMIHNKKRKNGKFKENDNDGDFHQPQRVSARRGEGDSYISKRRKARS
jgi:hypothetical protein